MILPADEFTGKTLLIITWSLEKRKNIPGSELRNERQVGDITQKPFINN